MQSRKGISFSSLINLVVAVCLVGSLSACSSESEHSDFKSRQNIPWDSYSVTDDHTITFKVTTGDERCYYVATGSAESEGLLKVKFVQGTRKDAPDECTAIGVIKEIKIRTKRVASTLKVEEMKE